MIKSRRNPGGTGGNCRPKLFLSQLFFKAKASVLEDALKSVWLKCLRVAVRPRTMNTWGLDGGVASLPCSHDSPVNCDYHPNTHCDRIPLPLPAAWLSKSRLVQLFEDTISFELTDDAVVDKILSLQPAELGIKAFKNTQSIAHAVDGRKSTPAIDERTASASSEEFLRGVLCGEPAESHCTR
jgi:hypothetical protein